MIQEETVSSYLARTQLHERPQFDAPDEDDPVPLCWSSKQSDIAQVAYQHFGFSGAETLDDMIHALLHNRVPYPTIYSRESWIESWHRYTPQLLRQTCSFYGVSYADDDPDSLICIRLTIEGVKRISKKQLIMKLGEAHKEIEEDKKEDVQNIDKSKMIQDGEKTSDYLIRVPLEDRPELHHSNEWKVIIFRKDGAGYAACQYFGLEPQGAKDHPNYKALNEAKIPGPLHFTNQWIESQYPVELLQFACRKFNVDYAEDDNCRVLCQYLNFERIIAIHSEDLDRELHPEKYVEAIVSNEEEEYHRRLLEWTPDPTSTPICDVNAPISWDDIQYFSFIPGGLGSNGVFVLEVPEGLVVVKYSKDVFPEIYASTFGRHLSDTLSTSWTIPDYHSICWKTGPVESLTAKLSHLDLIRRQGNAKETFIGHITRFTQAIHVGIVEFVVGKSLFELPYDSDIVQNTILTEQILKELGAAMLYDIIINNWDRLPLLWNNDGNGSNLMFSWETEEKSTVVLIDHAVTVIKNANQRTNYSTRAANFTSQVFAGNASVFNKVREYISMCIDYDIGEAGNEYMAAGYREAVQKLSDVNIDEMLNHVGEEAYNRMDLPPDICPPDMMAKIKANRDEIDMFVREMIDAVLSAANA